MPKLKLVVLEVQFEVGENDTLERVRRAVRSMERNKGRWSLKYFHEGDCLCPRPVRKKDLRRDPSCPSHGVKADPLKWGLRHPCTPR